LNLLLNTHAFIWWLDESARLSAAARSSIGDRGSMVHVSVASAWEIAIKVGQGRLPEASEILANFEAALQAEGFALLAITVAHARTAGLLASEHRDPFDRLLASQAIVEGLTLVTADPKLHSLGAPCLW